MAHAKVLVDLSQDINELTAGLIGLRRELHRHPGLAFEETWDRGDPGRTHARRRSCRPGRYRRHRGTSRARRSKARQLCSFAPTSTLYP
jgi:hypothetical protein